MKYRLDLTEDNQIWWISNLSYDLTNHFEIIILGGGHVWNFSVLWTVGLSTAQTRLAFETSHE